MAKAKRLTPKKDTLRELYLKSGNQCAFPGCARVMINADGVFVGQVCHIEAAEEGGERFNENMTDEQRAAFENLMLMCYEHHVITDDVATYTVPVLQRMKAGHEAKFTDIAKAIEDAISDKAAAGELRPAKTLQALNTILGIELDEEESEANLKEVEWAWQRVRMLPIRTRQLLAVIVGRLTRVTLPQGRYRYGPDVPHGEIVEACQLDDQEVVKHVKILERYEIGYGEQDRWSNEPPIIHLRETPEGWFLWGDLREFCERTDQPLHSILVDLQFDVLDG